MKHFILSWYNWGINLTNSKDYMKRDKSKSSQALHAAVVTSSGLGLRLWRNQQLCLLGSQPAGLRHDSGPSLSYTAGGNGVPATTGNLQSLENDEQPRREPLCAGEGGTVGAACGAELHLPYLGCSCTHPNGMIPG